MKIGLFSPEWPAGSAANGIVTTVSHLKDGLEKLGHDVTIIPLNYTALGSNDVATLPPVRRRTLIERASSRLSSTPAVHKITADRIAAAVIARGGVDVLVMEETHGWAADVQAKLDIPVIVTLHGPWFIQTQLQKTALDQNDKQRLKAEARAFGVCAGVCSPSQSVLDKTLAEHDKIAPLRAVIPNPISPKPAVDFASLSKNSQKSILFVGRYDYRKGADIVLDAFTQLVENGADATLTFVGPDVGITSVSRRCMYMQDALDALPDYVRQRITYLGKCSSAEIDALRVTHYLTIIASRYETFGYVVLEALASGCATISTAAGGPTEIIKNNETGLLIPVGDAAALAAACILLLNDPARAAALGAAGRLDVMDRFSPIHVAKLLEDFAQEVIADFHG